MPTSQYTIRRVSPTVDRKLRRIARASNRSINEVALEALQNGLGIQTISPVDFETTLAGLNAFDKAPKRASKLDPKRSIKELYRESIAEKHRSN